MNEDQETPPATILKNLLLNSSGDSFDETVHTMISSWDIRGPAPEQMLSLLMYLRSTDAFNKLSSFSQMTLQIVYELTLKDYNTTHSEVVEQLAKLTGN